MTLLPKRLVNTGEVPTILTAGAFHAESIALYDFTFKKVSKSASP